MVSEVQGSDVQPLLVVKDTHKPRHDIGRAALLRSLDIWAVRQHSPAQRSARPAALLAENAIEEFGHGRVTKLP